MLTDTLFNFVAQLRDVSINLDREKKKELETKTKTKTTLFTLENANN